ncbi:hypothetical protein OROGR_002120 [Orobanche gracilis]
MKDSDASIRKRALELVYLLVNENNVKSLTKKLVDYLEVSDSEFKEDLTAKICSIVDKFSPEKKWYIDQMLKVLTEAGNYVKDDVWHALIVVITNAPNLHGYTVRSLYKAVQTTVEQCIGEYGELLVSNAGVLDLEDPIIVTESDTMDIVETAIGRHSSDLTTRPMCLIALIKLSSRFPSCSKRINDIVCNHRGSLVLELQQRAIEFNTIIEKHEKIRSDLVERMPVLDDATFSGRRAGSMPASVSTSHGPPPRIPNGVVNPTLPPLLDLLDLTSDDVSAPDSFGGGVLQDLLGVDVSPPSSQGGTNHTQKSSTDVLMDLLSIGAPAQSSSSTLDLLSSSRDNKSSVDVLSTLASSPPAQASSPMMDLLDGFGTGPSLPETNGPTYPTIVAFESSSLKVTFNFLKESSSPQTTLIEAQFMNKSANVYSDFVFQAAVPKFLQLHLDPASSDTLPSSSNEYITQKLRVSNSQHGKKSLVMRVRINYKVNGKDVLEEGQINNFPRDL